MGTHKVTVFLLPAEEGGYVVFVPLFPECATQGDTVEKAFKNAKEAQELILKDPTEDNLECLALSHAPM